VSDIDPIYHEIAKGLKKEDSVAVPKMIAKIANLDQAKIILELPKSLEEIVEAVEMDTETVEAHLNYLYERGLVTPGRKGWNFVTNLVLLKDYIGSAHEKYDDDEVFDLAREMSLEDSEKLAKQIEDGEEIPPVWQGMRVVPKWRTIQDIAGVLPIEDTRKIFKDNDPIVVHRCPCRVVYRERPCKDDVPVDVCIGAGRAGEGSLARNTGGKIVTYDEVIALMDKLDDYGLVTMTGNSNRMPSAICSCCSDCCGLFVRTSYTKPLLNKNAYAKSRFVIEDNPEECISCGACTDERCPVDAITMKKYDEFDDERSYTDNDECIGCGLCVLSCPTAARKMKLVRPIEHIPDRKSAFD
jgi:ferredoxin/DNA-binding transcriptional ArsR family regulator